MPVSMKGSPSPTKNAPGLPGDDPNYLGFGSAPHYVPRSKLVFDPMRGGWVQPDQHRAGQDRQLPSNYSVGDAVTQSALQPAPNAPTNLRPYERRRQPEHYEQRHHGEWQLALKAEQELGLAPPDWSVSSAMDDTRPNGQALFDARFHGSSMGRARGGYSMVADARGMEFTSGKLAKAVNMDSDFFALDMADETELAKASAEKNKLGNNTNLASFDDASLAMAGMSALQRATEDLSKIDFD